MLSRSNSRLCDDDSPKYVIKLEQDFRVGQSLGHGAFGEIVTATHKVDNKDYAIKIIKPDSDMDTLEELRREVKNLSQLSHKNVVRYFNSWIETARLPDSKRYLTEEDQSLLEEVSALSQLGYFRSESELKNERGKDEYEVPYLLIQMELCDKRTLRTAIDDNLYKDETKLSKYLTEICEGLAHIHRHNIVHRDIKPENIFLTADDVIKIGDFGLSKQIALVTPEQENSLNHVPGYELAFGSLTGAVGSPFYTAPELYKKNTFNIKADIYSLGITYFEMCWEPLKTHMEKNQMFPLSKEKLKSMRFFRNHAKKKSLIGKLTHVNVNERLTCDQILDLLKSEKWPNEINTMIQQNKKVPRLQSKQFEKMLTSKTGEEINAMVVFTSTAARIFELHGARDIRLPMFLPNYSHHSDNLTTLINRHGNSTSLANTSRVAFSYYVTRNDIKSIRRYSIGRVFEEGYFTPTEYDECIFQAISPKPEDHVNDAECLYIAKKMCDSIFPTRQNEVLFFINHGFIYSHILKRCKIEKKNAVILTNLMINLSNQLATEGQILEALLSIGLSSESVNCILNSRKIGRVEEAEREMWRTKSKQRNQAFKQLKNVVDFASKFGINPDNIFLDPLLVNMTQGSGLMFKVVLKDQTVIATGGRFESLLKKCGKKIGPNLSAVDISFKVENILELLKKQHSSVSLVDVAIRTKNKETAIPLFTQLLSRGVRCEVVTKQESIQEISAIVVIELGEVNATVKIPLGLTTSEGLKLPKNKWKLTDDSFSDYIVDLVSTFGF